MKLSIFSVVIFNAFQISHCQDSDGHSVFRGTPYIYSPDLYVKGKEMDITVDGITQRVVRYNDVYVKQGDVVIPVNMSSDGNSLLSALSGNVWNCPIPFTKDGSLSQGASVAVDQAIKYWSEHTNWRFIEWTDEEDYLAFIDGPGCSASKGMIGGRQEVKNNQDCGTGAMIHEIGHAIGLAHEHTRPDRGEFVDILTGNILPGKEGNFDLDPTVENYGEYDFASIMHYELDAFTSDPGLNTIEPHDTVPTWMKIGQQCELSSGDIASVNDLLDSSCSAPPLNSDQQDHCDVLLCGRGGYNSGINGYYLYRGAENHLNNHPTYFEDKGGGLYVYYLQQSQFRGWVIGPDLGDPAFTAYIRDRSDSLDVLKYSQCWYIWNGSDCEIDCDMGTVCVGEKFFVEDTGETETPTDHTIEPTCAQRNEPCDVHSDCCKLCKQNHRCS